MGNIVRTNSGKVEEFGKDNGLIHEAVITGRKVGAGREFWSKLAHNEELFKKVVSFTMGIDINSDLEISPLEAIRIMGKNYLGPECWSSLGIFATDKERDYFHSAVPFSREELETCKDTHILVAICSVSILDIREKVLELGERNYKMIGVFKGFYPSCQPAWYNEELFAKEKCKYGWYLVRKYPVSGSFKKTYEEQLSLLEGNEKNPNAALVLYTIIAHYLLTHEKLFKNRYIRTSSVASDGNHVWIGIDGPFPAGWGDSFGFRKLGIAAIRKSNSNR
ncbi:MAG: hypothetical protein UT05_C0011G0021 [Parcubacteria group bacterium GW2011_GWF2_38_76]|nr:MAG: hypothetical protein UT05_C0011G0021 [Parcubacteria group bacterium GW2011_GWF2_38_76]HBM45377.1 hypothetical protein [Patescibacteria group bacterium]